TPSLCSCSAHRSIVSRLPPTTICAAPFTALTSTRPNSSRCRAMRSSISLSDSATLSIPPTSRCCIKRPRSATSRNASSHLNTPATVAATHSPTLWPSSPSGSTPHARNCSVNAYSVTNSAGCAHSVCCNCSLLLSSPYSTVRRSTPSSGSSASAHRSTVSRYTASLS